MKQKLIAAVQGATALSEQDKPSAQGVFLLELG